MKGSVFLPDAVHPLHLLMTSTDRVGLSNTPLIGQSCPWNPARKELEPITALSTHEIINDEFLWLVLGREILFHMWPAYVWPADPQFTWQIRQAIPIMHWLRAKYILGAPSQPWIGWFIDKEFYYRKKKKIDIQSGQYSKLGLKWQSLLWHYSSAQCRII